MVRRWKTSLVLLALPVVAPHAVAGPPALEPDSWSSPVTWKAPDGWYASAAHATLLPDGRVLFIGFERDQEDASLATATRRSAFVMSPHPLGQALPTEVVIDNLTQPVEADGDFFNPHVIFDDLFCTGHTLTADGAFFTAGGTRALFDIFSGEVAVIGLPYATVSDGDAWLRLDQTMVGSGPLGFPARWYPSCTRLPDGRILVTGGYDVVYPVPSFHRSVEVFDPATPGFTPLSFHGESPSAISNVDYTHPFVLPSTVSQFDVVMFGDAGLPVFFSTSSEPKWFTLPVPRPDTQPFQSPNHGASSAILPLRTEDGEWGYSNGSVLVAGGQADTSHHHSVDVFDPHALAWGEKIDTGVKRHHPTAVLLPTGRVLIVAGHDKDGDPNTKRNGYVDPRNGFQVTLGAEASQESRGYHHVALLLPDGRVLVGGGRDDVSTDSSEKVTFRYYSPPYMDKVRPRITQAPAEATYGGGMIVKTRGARPGEVVLMSLGSMTHSFDANQRYVELDIANLVKLADGSFQVIAATPDDPRVAPPGVYMLFVLDRFGVPSKATMLKLG